MDVARKQLDHFIAVSIETHVSLKDCITKGLSGEKKKKKNYDDYRCCYIFVNMVIIWKGIRIPLLH